ncbi:MAG: putative metalloprotease CJM1_0395 family protein [Alphaproteobacteria bacterium]
MQISSLLSQTALPKPAVKMAGACDCGGGCSSCQAKKDKNVAGADSSNSGVSDLKKTNDAVVAHEKAHQAAGGALAGGASYKYTTGPDGKRYAIAGEVPIDVAPVSGDPAATIQKMQIVQKAALAPADPSPQDYKVAALANQQLLQAQQELLSNKSDEQNPDQSSSAIIPANITKAIAQYNQHQQIADNK